MDITPVRGLPDGPLLDHEWLTRFSDDEETTRSAFGEALASDLRKTGRPPTSEEVDFLVSVRPYYALTNCLKQLTQPQLEWLAQTEPYLMLTTLESRSMLRRNPELLVQCAERSPAGALIAELETTGERLFSDEQRRDFVLSEARWVFRSPDRVHMLYSAGLLDGRDVYSIFKADPGALLQYPEVLDWVGDSGKLDQIIEACPEDAWTYAQDTLARKSPETRRKLALQAPKEAIRYGGHALDNATFDQCFDIVARERGYHMAEAQDAPGRLAEPEQSTASAEVHARTVRTWSSAVRGAQPETGWGTRP